MALKLICPEYKNMDIAKPAIDLYIKRLSAFINVQVIVFKPERSGDAKYKINKDADSILKKILEKDYVFVLDEFGKSFRTSDLSDKIKKLQNDVSGDLVFVVGSPYGLSDRIKQRANLKMQLSGFTFTSEVALAVLAEQLYRIFSYAAGHPYHNE